MSQNKQLHLHQRQNKISVSRNFKHESVLFPSSSQPAWSSQYTLYIRANGAFRIHEAALELTLGPITGIGGTPGAGYPNLNPLWFALSKFDILIGGVSVEGNRYDLEQFVLAQALNDDQDRIPINLGVNPYSSITTRYNNSTGTTCYIIPLRTFINSTHFALLSANHDLQINVTLPPLANICSVGAGTGTPNVVINSSNIRANITRLPQDEVVSLTRSLQTTGIDYRFHRLQYQSFNLNAGTTTNNCVLTAINGSVVNLFFVVRPTASITGNGAFTSPLPVSSFFLADSSGANMVGGVPIQGVEALYLYGPKWVQSSFLADAGLGINNSYFYFYSFSLDPLLSHKEGLQLNAKTFTSQESLNITMASALGAASQVDVYAYTQAILHQTPNGVSVYNAV